MPTRNRRFLWIAMLVCLLCAFQARRLRWVGEIGFAIDLIDQAYVQDVDPKELYRSAMRGMVGSLDPYSAYIEADDYSEFQKMIEQHFGGIGILVDGPPRMDRITIVTPLFGTPAYRAGLEPGDVILSIDGKVVEGMELDEATKLMKGPEGTSVTIEVSRSGAEQPIQRTIVRAAIEIESVVGDRRRKDARWDYFLEESPEIAYLRVTSFGEKTVEEFKKAIVEVRAQAKGLIVDLRDNPGGLLTAATEICDMFLDDGEIVTTKGRHGSFFSKIEAKKGVELPKDIPIAILVNDQSASASEVVAGCMRDRHRAIIVGQRSFGKGSVQNLVELDGGSAAIKLTTARYYPPSGQNIHREVNADENQVWGVKPDPRYEVVLNDEERKEVFKRWRIRGSGGVDVYQEIDAKELTASSPNTSTEPTEKEAERPATIVEPSQGRPEELQDAGKDALPMRDAQLEKAIEAIRHSLGSKETA